MLTLTDYNNQVKFLEDKIKSIQANYQQQYYYYPPIYFAPFTGEKTPGEMGAAKNYKLQYNYLRVRSWQSYIDSEVTFSIINKYLKWCVGSGLKLQPQPDNYILETENFTDLDADFIRKVESRFNIYAKSRHSDYAGMINLNKIAFEGLKNALIGGDVLVILRLVEGRIVTQILDGSHIISPYFHSEWFKAASARGNNILFGVEVNDKNEHINYYIQDNYGNVTIVPRIGENSGNLMAFMVYGSRYRIDNVRGMPLISCVLETMRKLERYKEAVLGSAEERQKIAYFIEHGINSTGEHPLLSKFAQSSNLGMGEAPETKSIDAYEAAASKIVTTTNKQVINLPLDSQIKAFDTRNELYFKDFYDTNIKLVCSAMDIPFEVAMMMYNSNYSASRAAMKDWEHSLIVQREDFADQFHQNIYNLWLEVEILKGKIQAKGYTKAMMDNNIMALEAYRSARWLGDNVPQIDPLKEVQAERLKLGDASTPLTTYDQATESLGTGDFSKIMEKIKQEQSLTDGLKKETPPVIKKGNPNEADDLIKNDKMNPIAYLNQKIIKIIEFPELRQVFNYDCGASALQSVMVFYGIELREDFILEQLEAQHTDIFDNGVHISAIIKMANDYGINAELKQSLQAADLIKFIKNESPVIILLQAWRDENNKIKWSDDYRDGHYVVAIGYTNDKIIFEDPSSFTRTFLSFDELNERWHAIDDDGKKNIKSQAIIFSGQKDFDSNDLKHMN